MTFPSSAREDSQDVLTPARELRLELPAALLDEIVERAAALVLERLNGGSSSASEFLSVPEAAELMRCKPQRIYDLVSSRQLERFKDGSRVLVRRADLVAHLLPTASQNGSRRAVRA